MFSTREYYTRMTFAILGTIAISMVFTRCSPLASSTSKFRNRAEPVSPISEPLSARQQVDAQLTESAPLARIPGLVMPLDDYEDETSLLPKEQKVTLSDKLNGDELESFKEERSLLLETSAAGTPECNAYFGLAMSEDMIDSLELNPIQIECSPISDDLVRFSISSNISDEKWDQLSEYLDSVTIYMTSEVRLAPAPVPAAGIAVAR